MLYFEDLKIGLSESSKPTQLSEAEIIEFASRFDPQPFHVNKQEAERSVFGGLTASSSHVIAVAFSLFHVTGMAHSITGGSAYEPTPWRAVQRAGWQALNKREA
jgi:acyl dehydratase